MIIDAINIPVVESWRQAANLEADGFKLFGFDSVNSKYYRAHAFTKDVFQIGFEVHPYQPEVVRYAGFNARLELTEVEAILRPLGKKYLKWLVDSEFPGDTILFSNLTGSHENIWVSLDYYHYQANFYQNNTLIRSFAQTVRQQISLYLEPFWQQYADLQFINHEIIDKVSDDDLGNYFGSMAPFKKLIIMKLCHNTGYDAFSESYQKRIAMAVIGERKSDYEPYLNLVNGLIATLDSL